MQAPQITLVPFGSINPYKNNARRHSLIQIEQIAKSLQAFGMVSGIIVRNHTIAKGHGTLAAIQQIYKEGGLLYPAPGQAAGIEPYPPGMVPIITADGWSEDQFKAYIIADNQLALNAGWNDDLLRLEIRGLEVAGFDTDLLGFSEREISGLFTNIDEKKRGEANQVPEVPIKPTSTRGDIWIMDGHRAMCGDSTSAEDLGALMNGELAALLHADPPYGAGKEKDGVLNDNLYAAKLDAFQVAWFLAARAHLTDSASAYIWGTAPDLWRLWYAARIERGEEVILGLGNTERFELRNEIVWDKKTIPGMKSDLMHSFPEASERCLFFQIGRQFLGNVNTDDYPEEYEPIRSYMEAEAEAVGLTPKDVKTICGCQMFSHWFTKSQFHLIGEKHYRKLQDAYPGHFGRAWSELKLEWDRIKGVKSGILGKKLAGLRSYFDNGHSIMRDVWEADRVLGEERYGHATPKPVILMERVMRSSLPKGGLCLEPFGGTGSTIIGAERTDRRCYSMELTPAYVDIEVTRWQNYTGGKAIHAQTGQTFEQVAAERAA